MIYFSNNCIYFYGIVLLICGVDYDKNRHLRLWTGTTKRLSCREVTWHKTFTGWSNGFFCFELRLSRTILILSFSWLYQKLPIFILLVFSYHHQFFIFFKVLPLTECKGTIFNLERSQQLPLTLFRMEGKKAPPPDQFFPCNFYKRRNYPLKLSDF